MTSLTRPQLVKWIKLTQVRNLGPRRIGDLIRAFKSIDAIFSAPNEQLLRSRAFRESMLPDWEKLKQASDENFIKAIEECGSNNISITTFLDEGYPEQLRRIPYPPLTLYLLGDQSLLTKRMIAIVGTREASEDARRWAFEQASELAKSGIVIVSGGATGIDYAAHTGALSVRDGKTVCVLGTGFFRMFPEEHKTLFDAIKKRGLLISEHLPNFPGSRIALIQRNRITSGLSNGLLLVASTNHGGSMVQAKTAADQRVPMYCPSLSLNLQPTEGTRQAIEKFGAKQILSAKEIL